MSLVYASGGIAQWQSIRLQIERSPVQLWLPPLLFLTSVHMQLKAKFILETIKYNRSSLVLAFRSVAFVEKLGLTYFMNKATSNQYMNKYVIAV